MCIRDSFRHASVLSPKFGRSEVSWVRTVCTPYWILVQRCLLTVSRKVPSAMPPENSNNFAHPIAINRYTGLQATVCFYHTAQTLVPVYFAAQLLRHTTVLCSWCDITQYWVSTFIGRRWRYANLSLYVASTMITSGPDDHYAWRCKYQLEYFDVNICQKNRAKWEMF